jgi:hypothetical protein
MGAAMLLDSLSQLEQNDNLHLGRLLLILKALSAHTPDRPVEGLTKLAKLDFLLRYPTYLERALDARHANRKSVATEDYERHSVESAMVRYRFGPWDQRYRRFLNILSAKGLIRVTVEGRKVIIMLTESGLAKAEQLASQDAFQQLDRRAQLLKNFDLTATNLMKFIYETFPEISSLRSGRTIR